MKVVLTKEKRHTLSVTQFRKILKNGDLTKKETYYCCKVDPWRNNEGYETSCQSMFGRQLLYMAILHFGTNNLKNDENAEDIAADMMSLAISVKTEKKKLVVSDINVRNDKFNDKGKNE